MDPATLITFALVALAAVLLPGPDIIFVMSKSVNRGAITGIYAALGIATGLVIHVTLAATGLSAILFASESAFMAVKYLGAAYILYLAYKILTDKSTGYDIIPPAKKRASNRQTYVQGVLTNLLNPKAALFFMSLLPQFVDRSLGHEIRQIVILGAEAVIIAAIVFSILALAISCVKRRMLDNPRAAAIHKWLSATLLGGSALLLMHAGK